MKIKKMNGVKDFSANLNSSDEYIQLIKSSQKRLKLQGITKPFQTNSQNEQKSPRKLLQTDRINIRTKPSYKPIVFHDLFDDDSSNDEFDKFKEENSNDKNISPLTPVNVLDFEDAKSIRSTRKRKSIIFHDPYDDDSTSSDDLEQILNPERQNTKYKTARELNYNERRLGKTKLRKRANVEKENIHNKTLNDDNSMKNRQNTRFSRVFENRNLNQFSSNEALNASNPDNFKHLEKNKSKSTWKYESDTYDINTRSQYFKTNVPCDKNSQYLENKNRGFSNTDKNSFDKQFNVLKELHNSGPCEEEHNTTCSQDSQISQYFKMRKDPENDRVSNNHKLNNTLSVCAPDAHNTKTRNCIYFHNTPFNVLKELSKTSDEEIVRNNNSTLESNSQNNLSSTPFGDLKELSKISDEEILRNSNSTLERNSQNNLSSANKLTPINSSQNYTNGTQQIQNISQEVSSPVICSNRKLLLEKLKNIEARIKLEDLLENINKTNASQTITEVKENTHYFPSKQSKKNKHQDFHIDDFLNQISEPKNHSVNNIPKNRCTFNSEEDSCSQSTFSTKFEILLESSLDDSLNSQTHRNNYKESAVNEKDFIESTNNIGSKCKSANSANWLIKERTQWETENNMSRTNESSISESFDNIKQNNATNGNTVSIGEILDSTDMDMFECGSQDVQSSQNMSIVEDIGVNISNQEHKKNIEDGRHFSSIQKDLQREKDVSNINQSSKNGLVTKALQNESSISTHLLHNTTFENSLSQDLFDDNHMVLNYGGLKTEINLNNNIIIKHEEENNILKGKFTLPSDIEVIKVSSQNKNISKTNGRKGVVGRPRARPVMKNKNNKTKAKSLDICTQTDEFEVCSNYSQGFSQNTFNLSQSHNDTILTVPEDNGVVILDIPEIFQMNDKYQIEKQVKMEKNKKRSMNSLLNSTTDLDCTFNTDFSISSRKTKKTKKKLLNYSLNNTNDLDCTINTDFSIITRKSSARSTNKNVIPENTEILKVFESVPNFVQSSKDIVISHRFIENSVVLSQAFNSTQEFVRNTNINTQNLENNEDFDDFVNSQMSQPDKIIVRGENTLVIDDKQNVPTSLIKLRKSIDDISRDPTLVCSKSHFEILPYDKIKAIILSKIAKVFYEMNEQTINNKKIIIKRKTCDWSNAECKDGRLVLKSKMSRLVDNRSSLLKMVVYLLKKVYNLLTMNSSINKREIYYQIINYAKSQNQVDRGVHIISLILNHGQWDFGILSTSKGLVHGNLKIITLEDECFYFNNSGGTLIPNKLTNIKKIESAAHFILIVEKDAIFQKLLDEDIPNKLGRPFILITGKGSPDINTRYFVNILWKLLQIPIFILVDADPYGIEIMMTYRFGSLNMAHKADELALPYARWIGVLPSEIETLNLERKCLTTTDVAKIKRILKRPYCDPNPKIKKELETMLANNHKAEIESLIKCNKFISNFYLPNKMLTKDFM